MRTIPIFPVLVLGTILCLGTPALAWEGHDYETGSDIEIEEGNLVRRDHDIEYFDYEAGEYRDGNVESIQRYGNEVDVEVYDYDSGKYRTFTMDGR